MQLYLLLSNQEREGGKERERENPPPVSPPVPALVKIHGIQLSWHQRCCIESRRFNRATAYKVCISE